jgi:hypothetical protein
MLRRVVRLKALDFEWCCLPQVRILQEQAATVLAIFYHHDKL